jgi:hypothetical protein
MKKQFVTNSKGERVSVILPIKEYQKMMEELYNVRLYDEAKMVSDPFMPLEEYVQKRKKKRNG